MKIIHGDLIKLALEGRFDVIIHGCNCFCSMGGGIARTIREVFPEAYAADLETENGSRAKLGTFTRAHISRDGRALTIVNGYTQYHPGGPGAADYNAIRSVMRGVKIAFTGRAIGYPRIGAGIAGGDWNVISAIIREELAGEDHTLVEYAP